MGQWDENSFEIRPEAWTDTYKHGVQAVYSGYACYPYVRRAGNSTYALDISTIYLSKIYVPCVPCYC
jgi:hypothetical protein